MNSVVTTAALAILADAALVLVRLVLTPWMPRGTRRVRRTRTATARPEPAAQPVLEDAVR